MPIDVITNPYPDPKWVRIKELTAENARLTAAAAEAAKLLKWCISDEPPEQHVDYRVKIVASIAALCSTGDSDA